jgi:hypothetical protein
MGIKKGIFTLTLCIIGSNLFAAKYTIEDLKILHQNQSYYEFFEHALDIPPTKRLEQWNSMVEELGTDFLDYVSKKTILDKKDIDVVNIISRWPVLRSNEFYNRKRDNIFIKQIRNCYINSEKDCAKFSTSIFNDYKHEAQFVIDFITTIYKYNKNYEQLWSFSSKLVSTPISEFYCKNEPLKTIIIEKIYSSAINKKLKEIDIHKDCLKTISPDIESDLLGKDKIKSKLAFQTLNHFSLISKDQLEIYYLINFISGQKKNSKQIDTALSLIKDLSNLPQKRTKIIKTISRLDPLPDGLFKEFNSKKTMAKTKILHRNIPELIDLYAHTCIDYLEENRPFPKGNPTPNCHNFFKLSKKLDIVPESLINKYDKATYFLKK